jgi:hypothetical protein
MRPIDQGVGRGEIAPVTMSSLRYREKVHSPWGEQLRRRKRFLSQPKNGVPLDHPSLQMLRRDKTARFFVPGAGENGLTHLSGIAFDH